MKAGAPHVNARVFADVRVTTSASAGAWAAGDTGTRGATGAQAPTGPIGPQGPTGGTWRFVPNGAPGRYEHQATSNRRFCVRVIVVHWEEAILALATRIHRNTREFEWREMDRKHRMATLPNGNFGVCKVADEGITWCRGWKGADAKALQAASALANT